MDLSRGQKLVVIVGLIAGLAGIVVLSLNRAASHEAAVTYTAPQEPAAPRATTIAVHVVGAVARPGMYWLRAGSRVADALALAGGLSAEADQSSVNLAAPLSDGEQIKVLALPQKPPEGASSTPASPAASSVPATSAPPPAAEAPAAVPPPKAQGLPFPLPLSLNQATRQQLEALPGIGPRLAERILYYRHEHGGFRTVEELAEVPGIDKRRLANLRPYVRP
jgi:competence protein ComEA